MESSAPHHPVCPGCGEPLGIYEALWRIAPDVGAERTSWLQLGMATRRSSRCGT
jgi:hypothetical protein